MDAGLDEDAEAPAGTITPLVSISDVPAAVPAKRTASDRCPAQRWTVDVATR